MTLAAILAASAALVGCHDAGSSDEVQRQQNEAILKEATAQTGMPAIKNFRERKMLKEIIELRDQEGLTTYTYIVNELNGKLMLLGESIGYGIPAAMQYTSPQKIDWAGSSSSQVVPQADPNGLFSPDSAEGTWVLLKDPHGSKVKPVYIEPRIVVSPFRLAVQ
jgi:hypothetical protein